MNRDAYFYLEMKEHELKVPYTGKNRRIRVLLPKGYAQDEHKHYPVDIRGRLYQRLREILICQK